MSRILKIILLLVISQYAFGQVARQNECPDYMRKNAAPLVNQEVLHQRRLEMGARAGLPYTMRLNVVVFYKSTPTVNDAVILRNIEDMANFYKPHNICFILSDIEYIQDSVMADFNTANEAMLQSYIRPYHINIFIHTYLWSPGWILNGNAYAIPNNYLSLVDDVVWSYSNISTMSHEMGHCFGLYHTFEDMNGTERVARNGLCKNCETTGDFLCDTDADQNINDSLISATSCLYTGSKVDNCDNSNFIMTPTNIMSYGRRPCRDHFTNGQGARSRDYILTETILYNCIAPDVLNITNSTNSTNGVYSLTAKNNINVNSSSYQITGNAQMTMTSTRIQISPGAVFRPAINSSGKIKLLVNPYCP